MIAKKHQILDLKFVLFNYSLCTGYRIYLALVLRNRKFFQYFTDNFALILTINIESFRNCKTFIKISVFKILSKMNIGDIVYVISQKIFVGEGK